ncbi:hypothetical protein S83_015219 [Arachis hypogaea]
MPRCMNLFFRPLKGMRFVGKELAIVAYIFSSDMDNREVIVEDKNSRGDLGALLTLLPGQMVVKNVINLVCTMLTHANRKESWFLLTTFLQLALSPVNHSIDTFEFICSRFMGYADDLWMVSILIPLKVFCDMCFSRFYYVSFVHVASWIYVPMYKDNHWYLMVVGLVNCKLLYPDFAKDSDHRESRVSHMKFVAFFVENMLEDKRFWKKEDHYKPHPSTFDVTEPPIG